MGCLCHWDGLRGDVQTERQNKRAGLFWGWLLRVVGAALGSWLAGRGCGDGEGTVRQKHDTETGQAGGLESKAPCLRLYLNFPWSSPASS